LIAYKTYGVSAGVSAGGVVSAGVSAGGVVSSVVSAGGAVVVSVSFAVSAQPLMTIAVTTSIEAKNFFIFFVSQKVT
jgi:hypothetical protein